MDYNCVKLGFLACVMHYAVRNAACVIPLMRHPASFSFFFFLRIINQPANQPTNQPTIQPTNLSINQPTNSAILLCGQCTRLETWKGMPLKGWRKSDPLGYDESEWNESGFRPLLCTYRLNWAKTASWGWWDEWDDTALQTQDSKFKPWRS